MFWRLIVAGLISLFISSYLDNARGPLLPIISRALDLNYSQVSWFLVGGNIAAVLGMFFLLPLSARFSEKTLTLIVLLFAFLGIFGSANASNFFELVCLAGLLGIGVATVGGLCNILILAGSLPSNRANFFCALHTMYGLGSFLAPIVVSKVLSLGNHWSVVLKGGALLFLLLAIWVNFSFPKQRVLQAPSQTRKWVPGSSFIIVLFSAYVAAEVICSMWMVTYFVEQQKLNFATASRHLSLFFLFMMLSRFICFLGIRPRLERKVLTGSLIASLFFFILGHLGFHWAFGFAGLMGPFFPLFLAHVSRAFPGYANSITLWMLTAVQITLACLHFLVGYLTDWIGICKTYLLPIPLLIFVILGLFFYFRKQSVQILD